MARSPRITRIQVHQYAWELADMGTDYNGFNQVYQPGNRLPMRGHVLTIETDVGHHRRVRRRRRAVASSASSART